MFSATFTKTLWNLCQIFTNNLIQLINQYNFGNIGRKIYFRENSMVWTSKEHKVNNGVSFLKIQPLKALMHQKRLCPCVLGPQSSFPIIRRRLCIQNSTLKYYAFEKILGKCSSLHLKSLNAFKLNVYKLTTLPTFCITRKLDWSPHIFICGVNLLNAWQQHLQMK